MRHRQPERDAACGLNLLCRRRAAFLLVFVPSSSLDVLFLLHLLLLPLFDDSFCIFHYASDTFSVFSFYCLYTDPPALSYIAPAPSDQLGHATPLSAAAAVLTLVKLPPLLAKL
jgi:hypothetical protein